MSDEHERDPDVRPTWSETGLPLCDDACPNFDGKRCKAMGFRPGRFCEPMLFQQAQESAALTAERNRLRERLDEAVAFIGKARELLGDWLSDAWSQHLADTTSEFFGSTDIAFGCEHVGCKQPFGHKHVIGGPAEQKASP